MGKDERDYRFDCEESWQVELLHILRKELEV